MSQASEINSVDDALKAAIVSLGRQAQVAPIPDRIRAAEILLRWSAFDGAIWVWPEERESEDD